MSIRDEALRLAAAGLPVLPLYGPAEGQEGQRGKHPRQTGWPEKRNTPSELAIIWNRHPQSNLGLVTGRASGLVCVDLDPRNGSDPWLEQYRAPLKAIGCLRERTGSGGWHLWFAHPGGTVLSRRGKHGIAPGVELLADGGHQAVIAPSVHKSGVTYHVAGGPDWVDLADFGPVLPDWLAKPVEVLGVDGVPVSSKRDRRVAESYADSPTDVALAERVLSDMEPAVQGAGGDHATLRAAMVGRDFNLSPEAFLPLLQAWNERCTPPWSDEELTVKLRNAYAYAKASAPGQASPVTAFAAAPPANAPNAPPLDAAAAAAQVVGLTDWTADVVLNRDQSWKSHVRNVQLVLTHDERVSGSFRFNLFTSSVEVVRAPWRGWQGPADWTDDDAVAFAQWMARSYPSRPTLDPSVVHAAVRPFARLHSYHPVRDYLQALTWDGVDRLGTWLITHAGAPDTPYVRSVSSRFLIGAVARVMRPGCKLDTMLVLEGQQGVGKSRLVRLLFNGWYTDAELDTSNKDVSAIIRGHWGVEFGEMHAASRAEVSQLKAFLSRCEDRQRDAYARAPETHPRQSVFVGTTNRDAYLLDATGGRRFWPVPVGGGGDTSSGGCGRIDLTGLAGVRDQLWAQAYAAFDGGEQWWLSASEEGPAAVEQALRRVEDDGEEMIAQWLAAGGDFGVSREALEAGVTCVEVWEGAFHGQRVTLRRADQQRVAECMRALGWKRQAFRRGTTVLKGFVKGYNGYNISHKPLS